MVGSTTSEVAITSGILPYLEVSYITTWLCKNFSLSHLKGLSKSVDFRFKRLPAQVLTGGRCIACGVWSESTRTYKTIDQIGTPRVIPRRQSSRNITTSQYVQFISHGQYVCLYKYLFRQLVYI